MPVTALLTKTYPEDLKSIEFKLNKFVTVSEKVDLPPVRKIAKKRTFGENKKILSGNFKNLKSYIIYCISTLS